MIVGGRYDYSDILSKQGGTLLNPHNIPNTPYAGTPYILVKYGDGDIRIMRWLKGDFSNLAYTLTSDEVKAVSGNNEETDPGDDETDGGKPPDFGPTGPVYTPLDPAGIAQRNYTPFYPQSYMPADPAYPTMGLLSQPAFGGTDLYQPWSAKYGQNVAPESLWNYKPPSGLDVAAGPKVTFQK